MSLFVHTFSVLSKRQATSSKLFVPCSNCKFVKSNRNFKTMSTRYQRWSRDRSRNQQSLEPPFEELVQHSNSSSPSHLLKPLAFTVAFSAASLSAAAIWQYENIRKRTSNRIHRSLQWYHERRASRGTLLDQIRQWWNGLSDADRVFIPLCAANVAVFLAWRFPPAQSVMVRFFCSNPGSRAVYSPMILSVFSHYSAMHIFANMYVLHSFSRGAVSAMGKEHFVGFYLVAGVVASMASYIHKTLTMRPGFSLGASGAIMGVLGYACTQYPDLDLSIIFLPFFTFKAAAALKVIMGIDTLGVLLGWKFFDHAAHLGGCLFGIFWALWGQQHIWKNRSAVVGVWHELRGPPSQS